MVLEIWAAIVVAYTLATVGYEYLRTKLANDGFEASAGNLLERWLQPGIFNKAREDERLKSPEQALTQSIEDFFNGLVGLSMAAVSYLFDLIMGMIQLYQIDKELAYKAVGWSMLGIAVVYWVGRSLVSLNERKGEKDGEMRTAITNANEADESNVEAEREKVLASLADVMFVKRRMQVVNRNVAAVSYPFNQWTVILGMVVIAPLYFTVLFNGASPLEIGVVTTAGLAFGKSVSSMTMLLQQFGGIASWLATIKRTGLFCEVLAEYEQKNLMPKPGLMSEVTGRLFDLCVRR
jgi:ABC-type uncharacterized transport system fused permease/ATPase subunit